MEAKAIEIRPLQPTIELTLKLTTTEADTLRKMLATYATGTSGLQESIAVGIRNAIYDILGPSFPRS